MNRDVSVKKIKEIYATTGALVVVVGLLYIGITGFFSNTGNEERSQRFAYTRKSLAKHI